MDFCLLGRLFWLEENVLYVHPLHGSGGVGVVGLGLTRRVFLALLETTDSTFYDSFCKNGINSHPCFLFDAMLCDAIHSCHSLDQYCMPQHRATKDYRD